MSVTYLCLASDVTQRISDFLSEPQEAAITA
jgi:hypothetical protein